VILPEFQTFLRDRHLAPEKNILLPRSDLLKPFNEMGEPHPAQLKSYYSPFLLIDNIPESSGGE